ncbi:MAG: hypothetical protein ACR2GN_10030 [Bacteroidia bacterium]
MRIKRRTKSCLNQRFRIRGIIIVVAATVSFITVVGFVIFLNVSNLDALKAEGEIIDKLGTGPIISRFTWENNNPLIPVTGPEGKSISKSAGVMAGGVSESQGLSAGFYNRDINLVLPGSEIFDTDGIDVSIDFCRYENFGSFFSRGNYFNFYLKNGSPAVTFSIYETDGRISTIQGVSNYVVPVDDQFRNLRFIYTPTTGKAELFANNIIIWGQNGIPNRKLYWNKGDDIIIGKGLNGNGVNKPIIDNLVIRSTIKMNSLPINLLSFTSTNKSGFVELKWITYSETMLLDYIIERSTNGGEFQQIGTVHATGYSDEPVYYQFLDEYPIEGTNFYRLRPKGFNGKSENLPVIANKYSNNSDTLDLEKMLVKAGL